LRLWSRRDAARTVRILVADGVNGIGKLLSPLLPNATVSAFPRASPIAARPLSGLTFQEVTVGGTATCAREAFGIFCCGFDEAP
jgi:hypothetical protein